MRGWRLKKAFSGAAFCAATLGVGALIALTLPSIATVGAATPSPTSLSAKVTVPGDVPKIPSGAIRLGPVPKSQVIRLDVGLAGQNPTGLAAEVAAVSTPGSPDYRHYLTPAQFAAAFGPSAGEVQAVRSSLTAQGLTVGAPTAGSDLLPVSGDARTVSNVFGTPLESVRLRGGATARVNTAAPEIPASLAHDITGIVGLSSLAREHAQLMPAKSASAANTAAPGDHAVAGAPQACSAASNAAGQSNYTSTQLATTYGLSQVLGQGRTGVGQTIGIVEFERFSNTDISTFESCYGLSNSTRVVTVDGIPTGSASGSGEAALDIEVAAVNAPSASIVVYEAPDNIDVAALDLYNRIATDDVAQVVTTSWGFCEQDNEPGAAAQENTIFERMAAQGQTMIAASGDSGSEDCYDTDGGTELSVDDPGSQPDVLSLGGTSLTGGDVASQSVWNNCLSQPLGYCQHESVNGAGGGGFSTVWPKPNWQPTLATGSGRMVPDFSLNADPRHGVVVYWGGWLDFGGTSEVAPSIAGFLADTNQGCRATLGLVAPALYAAASSGSNFTSVTTGNNDFTGTNGGDYAATGGDNPATGLGTPQEQNLALALEGGDGCPTVQSLSTASGAVTGAGAITLTGGGLADATTVSFGAAGAGTIISESGTSLVVIPPSPGQALCVNVTVSNPQGTSIPTTGDSFSFGATGMRGIPLRRFRRGRVRFR